MFGKRKCISLPNYEKIQVTKFKQLLLKVHLHRLKKKKKTLKNIFNNNGQLFNYILLHNLNQIIFLNCVN